MRAVLRLFSSIRDSHLRDLSGWVATIGSYPLHRSHHESANRNPNRRRDCSCRVRGVPSMVGASAADNPTSKTPAVAGQALSKLKQKCDQAVQKRESALSGDASHINSATDLSSGDKSALLGTESSDASGLTALDATIQADTTFSQAKTDCEKIVTDYRVYVVFEPQVHLVIAADRVGSVATKITALASELQQKLGSNTNPTVQAALADLQKQVAAAQTSVSGVSATVLAQTPSGYPGNKSVLTSALASVQSAIKDLKQARSDVETIKDAIHPSASASPAPSPSV